MLTRETDKSLSQVLCSDGVWDFYVLYTEIPQALVQELTRTQIQLSEEQDKIMWNETTSGMFNCQFAHHTLYKQEYSLNHQRSDWDCIWKSKITNKFKHFLWLAIQDRLATNSLRFKWKIITDSSCPQCQEGEETIIHILKYFKLAKLI